MSSIDHLMAFASSAAAVTALSPFGLAALDKNNNQTFSAPVILNVGGANNNSARIVKEKAVWDRSAPDPKNWTQTKPEVLETGWQCIVVRTKLDTQLRDLPGNACRMIVDRDKANAGDANCVLYVAPDITKEQFVAYHTEPTPLGARYPFGMPRDKTPAEEAAAVNAVSLAVI